MRTIELRAKLSGTMRDWQSGEDLIQLRARRSDLDALNALEGKELRVNVTEWKERRSLNANAYFHVLCHKIAEVLRLSDARAKNLLICRYGQPESINGEPAIIKTNIDEAAILEQELLHCRPVKMGADGVTFYAVYRGSHTYNTAEMAALIDGTVADAKELGIETMPPDELERMISKWGKEC